MIATHVSSPIRSARASGPIGCAKPSFAIVSIASGSATPPCSAYAASLMNGIRIRLETNPGKSRASAGTLPRSFASSTIAAAVSSEVCTARITSTSFSTGTGLKKCMPIDAVGARGGRGESRDRDRRRVRGEDRLVGEAPRRRARKTSVFVSASSTTASISRSAGTISSATVDASEHLAAGRPRPSPRASSGSSPSPSRPAPRRPGTGRGGRRAAPRRRPPGRSRRPSARHRRRGRARTSRRRAYIHLRLPFPQSPDGEHENENEYQDADHDLDALPARLVGDRQQRTRVDERARSGRVPGACRGAEHTDRDVVDERRSCASTSGSSDADFDLAADRAFHLLVDLEPVDTAVASSRSIDERARRTRSRRRRAAGGWSCPDT